MHTPKNEKDDPVWDLLKKVRPTTPSAFFSRNVVREVRKAEAERSESLSLWATCFAWLRQPAVLNTSLAALAIAALVITLTNHRSSDGGGGGSETPSPVDVAQVSPEAPVTPAPAVTAEYDPANEIENLAYLGELMAVTDPSLLDDNALADLLF